MRRVVKIGGSLLVRPRLNHDIDAWLLSQEPAETLVVVGGGSLIDAMRQLDAVHRGDPATIHWRCVDLLRTTYDFVAQRFPDWKKIDDSCALRAGCESGFSLRLPTLVSVSAFYRSGNEFGLPTDWRTTTDAIAAALAIETLAEETVLLKSCDVDPTATIKQFVAQGIVDEALPLIVDRVGKLRVERLPSV